MSFNPEDSLLAVLMAANECYWQVCEVVCADDFSPKGRQIFEAIATEIKAGRAVDSVVLGGLLSKALGDEAMDIAVSATGAIGNVQSYAKLVSERGEARRVREAGQRIVLSKTYSEALEHLAAVRPQQAAKAKTVKDGLSEMLDAMQMRTSGPSGLSWCIPGVDEIAGRLMPGRVYGIAGRAKMGKTTLSLAPQIGAIQRGVRVLNFSLEMTAGDLVTAAVANVGQIPHEYFEREDGVPDEAWPLINEACRSIHELPWLIDDQPGLTLDAMTSRAKQHHMEQELGIIVVDHLGLTKLAGKDTRNNELGLVTYGLKNLAKELKIPLLVLLQLNRKLEERMDKRPMMSDLRDSGNIEQDFDCIVSVYRDDVYHPESPDAEHAEVSTLANRHGKGGTAFVHADLGHKTFGQAKRERRCFPGDRSGSNRSAGSGSGFAGYAPARSKPRPFSVVGSDD